MDVADRIDGWLDAQVAGDLQRLAAEEKAVRRMATRLVRAGTNRDLRTLRAGLSDWTERLLRLAQAAEDTRSHLSEFALPVDDPDAVQSYASAFQRAVERAGVALEGAFPRYQAFPIAIEIDLTQEQAMVNRRRVHTLDPATLAAAVVREYRRVHAGSFNAQRFMRALVTAYDLLLATQPERQIAVQQVPLRRIYDLLVLRSGSADYSLTAFAFDLYRLRNTTDLTYEQRKLYFGYTRRQTGGIPVPTSPGHYENLAVLEVSPLEARPNG
jgi:hypothetical protein